MNRTLLGLALLAAAPAAFAQPPATAARRALLVGVTKYPNLAERFQLEGPANDVKLMRTTLVSRFGFADPDITTLSEADGAKQPTTLPTRANIEREFKRLAEVTKAGDEVVILLGGHGSQQPENPNSNDLEIDGLDEIFLPRDVGAWSDKVGTVENAIIDDELGDWIAAIQKKKAFVWLVVDACHSGTMMRGSNDVEKARKTDPVKELRVSEKAMQDAMDRAAKRPGGDRSRGETAKPTAMNLGGKTGVFAIYAAQPSETTPERPMPPDAGKNGVQHGVLTFAICQTLTQAETPMSYRELAQRVHQQYGAWGRTGPTPMVEFDADAPDREVLGPGVWKDRGTITLSVPREGEFKVNAGRLLGLTPGSILRVTSPAGMGDNVIGHVKVTPRATILDAEVEPCEYAGMKAVKELPADARCTIAFLDYGDVQLVVAVATHYPSTDEKLVPIPDAVRKPLVDRLKAAAKPDSLFRFAETPRDAAVWLVTPRPDGKVSLLPAAGWAPGKDPLKSKGYGPIPTDGKMEAWLTDALGRIARADGLVEMAASRTQDLLPAADLAPQLKSEIHLVDAAEKPIGTLPATTDLTVFDKDKVRLKVTNIGRVPLDLTALYVDTDHAIVGLFPKGGASNRVPPGKSLTVPIRIDGSTVGTERVVLVAVKAEGLEVTFLSLAQKGPDTLRNVRTRGDAAASRTAGRMDRLIFKSGGEDASRGAGADAVGDVAFGVVTWQVKGTPRPKAEPKK